MKMDESDSVTLRRKYVDFLRGMKWRVTRSIGIKLNNKERLLSFHYFEKRKKFATESISPAARR